MFDNRYKLQHAECDVQIGNRRKVYLLTEEHYPGSAAGLDVYALAAFDAENKQFALDEKAILEKTNPDRKYKLTLQYQYLAYTTEPVGGNEIYHD